MGIPVAIFGSGGFGREVLDVYEACNEVEPGRYELRGFLSEDEPAWGSEVNGLPILGGFEWLKREGRGTSVTCAIGTTHVRRRIVERCRALGAGFETVIHPRATVTRRIEIGEGTVVTAGVVITANIRIGDHVHLNLNTTVGHDVVIEDYATVAPGVNVSGNVTIGQGSDIGTAASILQGITIGQWSIVGAGAVVTSDLSANVTAVGIPARVIKERTPDWWAST